MKYKNPTFCLVMLITAISAGCTYNVALTPEAKKIAVLQSTKIAAKCQLLDDIWAYDVNGSTQSYQSHAHLYRDEINILKNKAALLGADTIVITKHEETFRGDPKKDNIDRHALIGHAYLCMT